MDQESKIKAIKELNFLKNMEIRDIKLRIWNPQQNKMLEGIGLTRLMLVAQKAPMMETELEQFIWMEGIGITDDADTEIYEKDIVEVTREYSTGEKIKFIEFIRDIRSIPNNLFGSAVTNRKIIGNAYENKALLEKII